MEGERPHRSGSSELFICFTSRPSSSSSSFMRISSKSIHSPGRPDKFRDGSSSSTSSSLHTSLSRRLRHNGSLKGGQASPMFPTTAKKKGCAFDTPEPTSPKVTCIGQVRVKTKKQGNKIRARSSKKRGELSFRRTQEGKDRAEEEGRLERRHQRWVSLPLSICEALRAFGADFNCFQPCGGRSSCASAEIDREKGEKRSTTTTTTGTCGAVFARWLMALQDGEEEKRRSLQEQVALVVEDSHRGEKEEAEEANKREELREEKVFIEEDETVPVCIPHKNALLLMRCRSEPFRMASYTQRFWESPALRDPEDENDEEEDDEEVDPCEEGESDVDEAEEDYLDNANVKLCCNEQEEEIPQVNIGCHEFPQAGEEEMMESKVETGYNGAVSPIVERESVENASSPELGEEPVSVARKSSSHEFVEEAAVLTGDSSSPDFVEEPITEEKSSSAELVVELVGVMEEEGSSAPESVEREEEEISWGEALDEPVDLTEVTEENGELLLVRSEHEEEEEEEGEVVQEVEEEEEKTESPRTEQGTEEEGKEEGQTNLLSPDPVVVDETSETNVEKGKDERNEEGRDGCSPSPSAASSVQSEAVAVSTNEGEVTEEQKAVGVEKEKSIGEESIAEEVEKDGDGERVGCGGDQERKEESDKSLPECLLLMLCEPKLSMEVSKETWVCSTDFLRWRPERKPKLIQEARADDRRRLSTDSNLAKPPPPAPARPLKPYPVSVQAPPSLPAHPAPAAPSMAAVVEQKLVNASAYGPFALTRCKSEPMRSSAKLAPEACFWKSGKLQQHPVGVGAAGIGF
ncbi:hypothetical protein H6P81_013890 [Aristolochia fimbriata]|uniref:Uncharacterized protein n=1 Tax=Aristolochia fimbriata TaxID=158543 RepID=A0AAV7EJL0_ARIFI|nr:hypothetical protein H6P81_013890 [Aristolochia fimbriata]